MRSSYNCNGVGQKFYGKTSQVSLLVAHDSEQIQILLGSKSVQYTGEEFEKYQMF